MRSRSCLLLAYAPSCGLLATYSKFGCAFHVFTASTPSNRKTQTLAPSTAVFPRITNLSMMIYIAAGIVLNGPNQRARQFSVPHSFSNLSSSGIKHNVSMTIWKKPMCTRGYVLSLYMLPKPTSSGMSAPQCMTLQTVCSSRIQRPTITSRIMRVKSGRRKR